MALPNYQLTIFHGLEISKNKQDIFSNSVIDPE